MMQPLPEPPPSIFRLNAAGCQCVTDLNAMWVWCERLVADLNLRFTNDSVQTLMLDRLKTLEERADDLEQENLHLTQQVGCMQAQPKPPAESLPV